MNKIAITKEANIGSEKSRIRIYIRIKRFHIKNRQTNNSARSINLTVDY